MLKHSQSASPVTSPRTLNPTAVFSQVRDAVNDDLHFTVKNTNSIPYNIASGRAPVPHASVSNKNVAQVLAFNPLPGLQNARQMHIEVFKAEPIRVDSVADAIQRYFNIEPRREPTSDPRNEASVARHPQQLLWDYVHWTEPYEWAVNGVKMMGSQAEFHSWAGSLRTELKNPGPTGIAAEPSHQPQPGRKPVASLSATGLDPAMAAQQAMGKLKEIFDKPKVEFLYSGVPMISDDPYFDPSYAAQNSMKRIRELLGTNGTTHIDGDIKLGLRIKSVLSANYRMPLQNTAIQLDLPEKNKAASASGLNTNTAINAYYGAGGRSQSFGASL